VAAASDGPSAAVPPGQPYDYYVVIDFEATCEADRAFDYPNEIIEFPAILLDGSDLSEVRTAAAATPALWRGCGLERG